VVDTESSITLNQRRVAALREFFSEEEHVDIYTNMNTIVYDDYDSPVMSLGIDEMDEDGELEGCMGEFLVFTYAEAVRAARQELIDNFDEYNCSLLENLSDRQDIISVIDVESWAESKVLECQTNSLNGLGEILAPYDNEEYEVIIDGKSMFIYRID
jgi:hypothetical protein